MKKLLLVLTIITTIVSCSSSDPIEIFTPTLPPITQTGANTFGCYIDGNLLTPRDGSGTIGGIGTPNGIEYLALGNGPNYIYNEIRVQDYQSGTGGIVKIHITELHQNGEGNFTINESNCEDGLDANPTINIHCRWLDEVSQTYKWYCSIENAGVLTITRYDLDNRIFSGTFSCTLQNRDDPNDIIEITDGRFDFHWATINETEFP